MKSASIVRSTFVLLLVATVFLGCRPTLLFVGDPALEAGVADRRAFDERIRDAAAEEGYRAVTVWPAAASLDSLDVFPMLDEEQADVTVLSPYLSLFADDIATRYPARRFIAFYGSRYEPNVTLVDFDAGAALRRAGAALAEWVLAGPGRKTFALVDTSDRAIAAEALALAASYLDASGMGLPRHDFATAPTRDALRTTIESAVDSSEQAVVVFLGTASGIAFELLRSDDVKLVVRDAQEIDASRVIIDIRDDLAAGISEALRLRPGSMTVVSSIADVAAGIGTH